MMFIHRKITRILFLYICFVFVAACSQQNDAPNDINDDIKILRKLTESVWTDMLGNSIYYRLKEGLPIEKIEDITIEQHRRNLEKAGEWRSQLAKIDSSKLAGNDLITYEILDFQFKDDGANDDDYWLTFDITAYVGAEVFQSAQQALDLKVISDFKSAENYLILVGEISDVIEQMRIKIEGQIERGIYLSKHALPSVRATWLRMQENIPSWVRVEDGRLDSLSEDEKKTFRTALETILSDRIIAGFDDLLNILGEKYEANAPESVGLNQYAGGSGVYKRLVRRYTTLNLTPEQIHANGIQAVKEISSRMKKIRDELGFKGSAREFHDQLKTDSKFIAKTPADVESKYMAYIRRIEPKLGSYFKYIPKTPYGVKRLSLEAEPSMTFGYYDMSMAPKPIGYYFYNGSDLINRSLIGAGSLIYHELVPGHHFQLAIQRENEELQSFRKYYLVSASTEGWAEYAASLGVELGLYETPYELYGRYIMEMFLATRLVVDTGMNAFGWSLEDARSYMLKHVYLSDVEIASETLRYSTSIPGQALAYRLGFEKIWQLRKSAKKALGDKFDIRDFHNIILSDGVKPLVVLEAKVNRYITETKKK